MREVRVLVVEDENGCRDLYVETLRDEGYSVLACGGVEDAMTLGAAFLPHVLLTDWKLRDTADGVAVAAGLLRTVPDLSIVCISGSPSDELRAETAGLPVVEILEKPCGIDRLVSSVRRAASKLRRDGEPSP